MCSVRVTVMKFTQYILKRTIILDIKYVVNLTPDWVKLTVIVFDFFTH